MAEPSSKSAYLILAEMEVILFHWKILYKRRQILMVPRLQKKYSNYSTDFNAPPYCGYGQIL